MSSLGCLQANVIMGENYVKYDETLFPCQLQLYYSLLLQKPLCRQNWLIKLITKSILQIYLMWFVVPDLPWCLVRKRKFFKVKHILKYWLWSKHELSKGFLKLPIVVCYQLIVINWVNFSLLHKLIRNQCSGSVLYLPSFLFVLQLFSACYFYLSNL